MRAKLIDVFTRRQLRLTRIIFITQVKLNEQTLIDF